MRNWPLEPGLEGWLSNEHKVGLGVSGRGEA